MDFKALEDKALTVRRKYAALEQQLYGREWSGEELMLGFLGDVGDLAKLVQAKEGVRLTDDLDEKLGHELSDCLWSIMILANKYGIDLEAAFTRTMEELENRFRA